jgi:drug/metabolite transporter (DMT)-like permease
MDYIHCATDPFNPYAGPRAAKRREFKNPLLEMLGVYESLVVISEVVLSAYPLLIKLVDASVFFQVGLRMFVFSGMAALAALLTGSPLGSHLLSLETALTGLLNLLHVGGSYVGFDQLAGGNAMALFYTYPVWNILGAAVAFGEHISMSALPWIGLALAGAVALAQPSLTNWTLIGVAAALLAAVTETGIYLWFRRSGAVAKGGNKEKEEAGKDDAPWAKMLQMYGGSGVLWLLGAVVFAALGYISPSTFKTSGLGWIVGFNAIIGFLGYALRFYLIPKVSTVVFSALSFFGVISAYLFSWLFAGEIPTAIQAAGAAALIIANTVLVTREVV